MLKSQSSHTKTSERQLKRKLFFVATLILLLLQLLVCSNTQSSDDSSTKLVESANCGLTSVNGYVNVNVSEAKQMIETNPSLVILDVRTQEEYDEGHLENAVLIPVSELESRLDELNKDKPILVYCKLGGRSATASQILVDNGFSGVYNMLGGVTAWRDVAYPVYVKYHSIQEAINNVQEEDTIYVSSGTYYENVVVNKTVALVGENRSTTVIDGSGIGSVVTVTHDNVNITSFTIRNSGVTISDTVPDAGTSISNVSNCNLSRNILEHNYVGIFVRPSRTAWFANNVITRNHIGIDINNQSTYNIISGNSLQENNVSIHVYYADFNDFFENNLTLSPVGVIVRNSSSNTFSENEIRQGLNGIILNGADFNNISRNIMSNLEYGIQLKTYADHNLISENSLTNCSYAGLDLDEHACNNSLSNNGIANSEVGIDISNGSVNNTISRNRLTANLVGMHFWYANVNTICENNIASNHAGVVVLHSQSNTFYHNTFLNNTQQVNISNDYTNFWDEGYPSGGNYWSDHNPPDADLDKIGDLSYVIDEDNVDSYPLIYPYAFVPKPDVNDDGIINIKDLFTVARAFGTKPGDDGWNPIADVEMDEVIGIKDLYEIAKDYGKTV